MQSLSDYEYADTISIDTLALEELVLEERSREIAQLNNLSKKVCFLHTSLLYYRNMKSKMGIASYEAWKTLIKKVGGSPNCWRDLGYVLGVSQDDLDYISNSVKEDPADIVLKVYMQNEKATLDKVLDGFVKLNRYDILKSLEEPLSDLAECFNKEDSGYQSNSKKNGQREIISYTKVINDLPMPLNKTIIIKNNEPPRQNQPIIMPIPKPVENKSEDGPKLFLTFMDDGAETAVSIQNSVNSWDDITGVDVITLNDRRDEVYQNPEMFIREQFQKANYIVPILTSSYMEEIRSHTASASNRSDNLDQKYVKFIYNLIVNHYVHGTACFNTKVRSVVPENADISVLQNISMYPDLTPWTYENDFDEQFKAFFKYDFSL